MRENVDKSTIENERSTGDYDKETTDTITTKPIEGNGNNRDAVDASKRSESRTNPSTTDIVGEIINNMIHNITENTTDITGDNLVRISSKNDTLNDIEDDDSLSTDLEKYVGSNESTTSIDNALSLLHKLHLEKEDTNDKDTNGTKGTNNNENSSQNYNTSCKKTTNSQQNETVNEGSLEESENECDEYQNSVMTPSVTPPKLPEILPFTNTNVNNTSRGKQIPIPPPGKELVIPPTATIAGGSSSKIFIEYIKENQNKKKLKEQKGLSGCSGLFCPNIYLYGHYTVEEKMKSFDPHKGPFALGKITQVPNH